MSELADMKDVVKELARLPPATARPPQRGPVPVENEREAALAQLMKVEAECRAAASEVELMSLIANETRKLVRARQVFVFRRRADGFRILAVSSLAVVDRNTPLVQWLERTIERLGAESNLDKNREFDLAAYHEPGRTSAERYPLPQALWVPLQDRMQDVFAGVLLTREIPWQKRDEIVADRLAGTYAHAWKALMPAARLPGWVRPRGTVIAFASVLAAVLGLTPVSLTTLAPAEVAARDGFVVTAPIDGVIEDIPVEPNTDVAADATLIKFVDTTVRSRFDVAVREVVVAQARLKKMTQLAFQDVQGRHELGIARAELQLRLAERDYAQDLLAKSVLKADRKGVVIFAGKSELIGRPVSVGERIMEIADPRRIEFRIDVPVGDAIVLGNGARAKIYLDSDPLHPIEAKVVRSDYKARVHEGNVLSFRVVATPTDPGRLPRLGIRGTAQLYGDEVRLGFFLLRRPIASLRQWMGI